MPRPPRSSPAPSASGAPAPDLPAIPRVPLSRRAIVLGAFSALVIVGYGAIAYSDYEPGTPARDDIPASVRSSPGGYRSFHFWHSGYHGGK